MTDSDAFDRPEEIAIIGLAGRFPGARNVEEFWENLKSGVESISFFSEEELAASGIDPSIFQHPNYVAAKGIIEDIDLFDASFFGFNPREAELLDPQHRLFLECAFESLENAGYNPETYPGSIGVYAGVSLNSYYWTNLISNSDLINSVGIFQTVIGNDKDFLPTRVSYKLNLKGPSLSVQTACSTSLVAAHIACQNLLNGECDMALAGGVSITLPQKSGYFYQQGGIASPDGHCRPFDAGAKGTVIGNGAGVVVLKRLSDAIRDGDQIQAIIKGSSVNNDGSAKIGYTAPGVDGQAAAIVEALSISDVEPETVGYIETHGTGTALGDPIEIAALNRAFGSKAASRSCAIGSVKSNVGHLDAAAGITGLIKTALALKHKQLPPSLNFERENPEIDFDSGPFYVNTRLADWQADRTPRRAGVSSFGIGGTNAHMILEEAPERTASSETRPWQLLVLSAKTLGSLDRAGVNLAEHLKIQPEINIGDVAYTLQAGRSVFNHRRIMIVRDLQDAIEVLETRDPKRIFAGEQQSHDRRATFMFPGQGTQRVGMTRNLYERERDFREQVDYCSQILKQHLGIDLRKVLYPGNADYSEAARLISQTWITQPALFVVEYALARLWIEWGVRPQAMIGHSLGEYVAACLADVISIEDALALVAARGRLMQQLPKGAMLAVGLSEDKVLPLLDERLSLAAVNSPSSCVVSGSTDAIDDFEKRLASTHKKYRRLETSHAFHSEMMTPVLDDFAEQVSRTTLRAPTVPYVSNLTGGWIRAEEVRDVGYWVKHLRHTVRFGEGMRRMLADIEGALLEVGPGQVLSGLARQQSEKLANHVVVSSLAPQSGVDNEVASILMAMGQLWLAGVRPDWSAFYREERRCRIALPAYPFEKKRYWIEPQKKTEQLETRSHLYRQADIKDWFYLPRWKQSSLPHTDQKAYRSDQPCKWIVFVDKSGLGVKVAARLEQFGRDVVSVFAGDVLIKLSEKVYTIAPLRVSDYENLFSDLALSDRTSIRIAHFWNVSSDENTTIDLERFNQSQEPGFISLLLLARALGNLNTGEPVQIAAISSELQDIAGEGSLSLEKATLLAACKIISHEYPETTCRSIDITMPESESYQERRLIDQLAGELIAKTTDSIVALRGGYRWTQILERSPLNEQTLAVKKFREQGVYLITGGLTDAGLSIAEAVATMSKPKLILIEPDAFLHREEWESWLASQNDSNDVSRKIRRLQRIEKLGAEVMTVTADPENEQQMRGVLTKAVERFGAVNGVLHAVTTIDSRSHSELEPVAILESIRPIVYGAVVIGRLFEDTDVDFLMLCSSGASLFENGGIESCASDAFLNAFALQKSLTSNLPVLAVNCANWKDAVEHSGLTTESDGAHIYDDKITPEEYASVFRRAVSSGHSQVIVSPRDLFAIIERSKTARQISSRSEGAARKATHARPVLSTLYVAPGNETERMLVAIWQEILGIEEIGVHDNFFDLGGHSLLATQLASRIRECFEVELPLRSMFETPTVANLAESILSFERGSKQALSLRRVNRDSELELSFGQQRLWFLDQLEPGNSFYNIPSAVRLEGKLEASVLERSLNEVVSRHEVLRTNYFIQDDRPRQVISSEAILKLKMIDLCELGMSEQEIETSRLALEEAETSFDLSEGLLLRATLLRLDEQQHVLLFTMHHIASDAWSLGLVIDEVATLYESFIKGRPSPLAALPCQYADYAAWQQQLLRDGSLDGQLSYWKRKLSGVGDPLELPLDRPRSLKSGYRGACQIFNLPVDLSKSIIELARKEEATLFMLLLAAFKTLLFRYTGREDILIGTVIAGRNQSETEKLIGLFINTLLLRTDLSGNPRFRDLLQRVKQTALEAYAHQDLPFEKVVEELRPDRRLSDNPFFRMTFGLQNTPRREAQLPALKLNAINLQSEAARFDITLWMNESERGLEGVWTYSTELFNHSTITRMTGHYVRLLESITNEPESRVKSLEIYTQEERAKQEMEQEQWEASSARKLIAMRRRPISASGNTN